MTDWSGTADWTQFFPPGAEVMALPTWGAPRLFISAAGASQRWRRSALYPSFQWHSHLFRLVLRIGAAASLMPKKTAPARAGWSLGAFVREALPQVSSVSVLPGWPGPDQKITVQCWNENDQVAGYLKYAEKSPARARLRREYEVLRCLPEGAGPVPLKYGPWHRGEALLTTPLPGRPLPVTLPPPREVAAFAHRLMAGPQRFAVEDHPWVKDQDRPPALERCLDALEDRPWPIAVQHGDLTPWNLRRGPGGALRAFDWEHGTARGFPCLDLAHYVLQVADLINDWPPRKAMRHAVQYLVGQPALPLAREEAAAIVRLAAYDAYRVAVEDGYDPDADFQQWRRAIWECNMRNN